MNRGEVPVVVDTREQKPYDFSEVGVDNVVHEKLDVGDYTLKGFEHDFVVERKSLDDLANSLGTERGRFENEILRANGYAHRNEKQNPIPGTKPDYELDEFTVVIEASENQVYGYRNKPNCPHYYSDMHPNSIIGTIEKWPKKYDTLEFVWAGDRFGGLQETLSLLDKWYLDYS
jgi:hypothetical protein